MRRISIGVTVVVSALAVLLFSESLSSQGRRLGRFEVEDINAREAVAREILVKFRELPQPAQLGQLAAQADAENLQPVGRTGIIRIQSRSRSAAALLASLANRPDIAFVEPNYIVQALSDPSDPLFPNCGVSRTSATDQRGAAGTAAADMRAG